MSAAINGSIQYVSIVTFPILKWGMNIIEAITPTKDKTEIFSDKKASKYLENQKITVPLHHF